MTMGVFRIGSFLRTARTAEVYEAGEMAIAQCAAVGDMMKAPAKAPSAQDLVGQSFGTNGYNNIQNGGWETAGTYVESANGNDLVLRGWLLGIERIKATYDAATGTITIPLVGHGRAVPGEKSWFFGLWTTKRKSIPASAWNTMLKESISVSGEKPSSNDREFLGPLFTTSGSGLNVMMCITTKSNWTTKRAYSFLTASNMQTIPALCETLGTGLTGVFEYNAADWKPASGKSPVPGWMGFAPVLQIRPFLHGLLMSWRV